LRKTMLATAAALLAAAPAPARADVLAGGPVYGYPQQDQLAGCFLFNAGPAAVALSSLAIVGPTGPVEGYSQNTCGPSLGAGQVCGSVSVATRQGPYACTVTTPAGAGAYLRGAVGVGTLPDPSDITVPLQLTPSPPG
jgi:hypothetical protein